MTARRTPGTGPQDKVRDIKSAPSKVHFSFIEEQEDEQPLEVFAFEDEDGTLIELTDPTDIDIETVSAFENPLEFLRHTTTNDEDRARLRKFSSKKMGRLIKAYFSHYGIPIPEGKGSGLPF